MSEPLRVAVFGASGGIGAALVASLAARPDCGVVYAAARGAVAQADRVRPLHFDLGDEASIAACAQQIGPGLDLCVVATGILSPAGSSGPEKTYLAIDGVQMAETLRLNTIGPALIAKHMLPLLRADQRAVFAALSARVGSIGDNRLGGWHSYRASKAALNMLIRNFAIELGRTRPQAIAVALHPGTVATSLSAPFVRGQGSRTVFTPAESAAHLLSVIDRLTRDDNGAILAWDGRRIPE